MERKGEGGEKQEIRSQSEAKEEGKELKREREKKITSREGRRQGRKECRGGRERPKFVSLREGLGWSLFETHLLHLVIVSLLKVTSSLMRGR